MSTLTRPSVRSVPAPALPARRSLNAILDPLDRITNDCSRILSTAHGHFESAGERYMLPRYLYVGRKGGGDMIRVGIFAAIHGDEIAGAQALPRFLQRLIERPEIGQGFGLFIYPLCNPTGYEDNTRHARSGKDLNREFWKDSKEPEVRFLESEIWMQAFDGIITLHSDDTSDGLYGFVRGAVLSQHLLEPALRAASRHLPRNQQPLIDGFEAREGIIHQGPPGMLQSIPGLNHPPFEVTLETPQNAPLDRQIDAFTTALETILTEYRVLQSVAQNI